eukprot:scaffold9170_cov28-Tisochrysis_lutea.AAC.3
MTSQASYLKSTGGGVRELPRAEVGLGDRLAYTGACTVRCQGAQVGCDSERSAIRRAASRAPRCLAKRLAKRVIDRLGNKCAQLVGQHRHRPWCERRIGARQIDAHHMLLGTGDSLAPSAPAPLARVTSGTAVAAPSPPRPSPVSGGVLTAGGARARRRSAAGSVRSTVSMHNASRAGNSSRAWPAVAEPSARPIDSKSTSEKSPQPREPSD